MNGFQLQRQPMVPPTLDVISFAVIGWKELACFSLNHFVACGPKSYNGRFQARFLLL
jgi:hypothetical protein